MNAQGFDGLPKVAGKEEFDKAVKESGFVAQRSYGAPTEEMSYCNDHHEEPYLRLKQQDVMSAWYF